MGVTILKPTAHIHPGAALKQILNQGGNHDDRTD
jgi:hypothetical protein